MAKKPRKQKSASSRTPTQKVDAPIEETSSIPRPAVLIIIGIVLLMLGLTVGVVIDVVSRPDPVPVQTQPQGPARPDPNVAPPRIDVPKQQSFFDRPEEDALSEAETVGMDSVPALAPLALNAAPVDVPLDWPVVAIVIDDMGLDKARSEKMVATVGPLTLSYLTYADDLNGQAQDAIDAGHEVMAHIPMEPVGAADPGPGALMTDASPADLREQLDRFLNGWTGYVGINNHMGSKLTANRAAMDVVMLELKERGLMWLDSRTVATTVGEESAAAMGVPHLGRDVFLDNEDDVTAIAKQLSEVEAVARRQGYAIAIGHPRDATRQALEAWLATLEAKQIGLVPITEVLRRQAAKNRLAGRG